MPLSCAVIRKLGNEWRVCANDYSADHEVTKKTLDEALKELRRLIEQAEA